LVLCRRWLLAAAAIMFSACLRVRDHTQVCKHGAQFSKNLMTNVRKTYDKV